MRNLTDYKTHEFSQEESEFILNLIERKTCKFCHNEFMPIAGYYQHDGGWNTSKFPEKVWIWVTCSNCNHEWSLTHIGVGRDKFIQF